MLTNGKNERFITLKDHKPNFKNNPKVRLINPAKNEIGRDSKNILDKINHVILDSLRINHWKDKHEVIGWLLKIPDKNRYKFKNITGPELERMKNNFQSLFIKYGLIECNKNVVDYLDVTFNLKDGTLNHKPDNNITYMNVQSNHPPNIIKQLPKTIEQQLSKNSSNETIFNEAAPLYEKALSKAG